MTTVNLFHAHLGYDNNFSIDGTLEFPKEDVIDTPLLHLMYRTKTNVDATTTITITLPNEHKNNDYMQKANVEGLDQVIKGLIRAKEILTSRFELSKLNNAK